MGLGHLPRHASPWPINRTSHGVQNGQAEREQALCMVFLREFGLGNPTEQSSGSGTSILSHAFRLRPGKGLSN